jgi:hypothetical protein
MIVQTFKVNLTGVFGRDEEYDHNHWELDCVHVMHIFELLLEQLNMEESDTLCYFDGSQPGAPQVWKMASYNSTFYVVAREVTDEEIAEAESKVND